MPVPRHLYERQGAGSTHRLHKRSGGLPHPLPPPSHFHKLGRGHRVGSARPTAAAHLADPPGHHCYNELRCRHLAKGWLLPLPRFKDLLAAASPTGRNAIRSPWVWTWPACRRQWSWCAHGALLPNCVCCSRAGCCSTGRSVAGPTRCSGSSRLRSPMWRFSFTCWRLGGSCRSMTPSPRTGRNSAVTVRIGSRSGTCYNIGLDFPPAVSLWAMPSS